MFKNIAIVALGASAAMAQVSTILSDFASIQSQTSSLNSALQGFSGSITSAEPILGAANKLKTTVTGTITAVKNTGSVTSQDQANVLMAAEKLYPLIIQSLDTFVSKKSQFASANLTPVAAQQLSGIASAANSLASALVAKATGDFQTAAKTLASNIAAAFSSAEAGNAPQSMALPNIPSGGSSSGGSGSSSSSPSSTSAASSGKASSPAKASSSAPVSTPTSGSTGGSSGSSSGSATAPAYTGAAGKLVSNVGGAVLLAAAAFAL